MIAVKAEQDRLQVTTPTEGLTQEEVNRFVSWLRVESIVRRSKLARGRLAIVRGHQSGLVASEREARFR